MMVVVVMVPGLCWDNESGGRSLVSAIVLPGMVQAYVGQKLLKRDILRVFWMSDFINI